MATEQGVGPYKDAFGVEVDYASFPKREEEVRQALLNNPNRFQAISQREDRSDIPLEACVAHMKGKYFIKHRGCMVLKTADDQTIIKELLVHVKPATVIELGTFTGGTAVWIADMMKMEDVTCSVYSMDINPAIIEDRVKEIKPENVTFLQGDSNKVADTFTADFLKGLPHPWVVIEDSHESVSGTLEYFLGYMEVGDYFVVEDTHPHLPAQLGYGRIFKGEYTSCSNTLLTIVKEFLAKHEKECAVDSYFTDFFGYNGTWNWHGFIRRM
jgi:cephalosporin hydroxylase